MRFALILSLVLAILAVVFALQNPQYMDVNLGPWDIRESTALVLMITLAFGVLVGVLATTPALMKRRKQVRHLERRSAETPPQESAPTTEARREPEIQPTPHRPHRP